MGEYALALDLAANPDDGAGKVMRDEVFGIGPAEHWR